MKRRHFLQLTGAVGALAAPHAAHAALDASAASAGAATVLDHQGNVGGRSLDDLITRYRYDLFDDFLPFMDAHVIDHEFGGFMCHADRSGNQISPEKRSRYEGRGTWVYAHLYRTLAPEGRYLEVARKSVEFMLRTKPDGDAMWPSAMNREGAPAKDEGMLIAGKRYPSGGEVYDELFVAEGFVAYARAANKPEFIDRAIDIMARCVRVYDSPDYAPTAPLVYMGGADAPVLPGCRLLGVWMILIRLATQMLEAREDARVQAVADRCIESILTHHYNKDVDLQLEIRNHDFSTPEAIYAQLAYTGHAIETLWMLMAEALRRKDGGLFDEAARRFKRHLDVAWDDVYNGWFRGCLNVDENRWILDKALWVQEEALVGLSMIIEHTGTEWAKAWMARAYPYVIETYPLKRHGYALWDIYADRRVTFVEKLDRIENFHHPRHLMLVLESLLRMKERDGAVSGIFNS